MKLSTFLPVSALGFVQSQRIPKEHLLKKLPDTGEQWSTLQNGVEYQPARNLSPLAQEHLRRLADNNYGNNYNGDDDGNNGGYQYNANGAGNNYNYHGNENATVYTTSERKTTGSSDGFDTSMSKIFVDGAETHYDEYAQAWRALGFYIDCDAQDEDRHRRGLEDNHGGCQRYLLWAAYIDEEYSGNGIGEYMYWDRKTSTWSDAACKAENSTRCVKMDCHNSDTHFSLLGFFKEPNYGEWMEQLFKHQGDCVWTDDEYQFMQKNREVWPRGCTNTTYGDKNGNTLYYDIKPAMYGDYDIGLYTDTDCIVEYTGSLSVEEALSGTWCGQDTQRQQDDDDGNQYQQYLKDYKFQKYLCDICGGDDCTKLSNYDMTAVYYAANVMNYGDDDDDDDDDDDEDRSIWKLEEELDQWNDAFDVFKQCMPCKTGSLIEIWGQSANEDGDRYDNPGRRLQEDGGDQEFHCHDDAGYDNVNQCMKFKTKTRMMTATFRDVELAIAQGSIYGPNEAATSNKSIEYVIAWSFLFFSAVVFGCSVNSYLRARGEVDDNNVEPLIRNTQAASLYNIHVS